MIRQNIYIMGNLDQNNYTLRLTTSCQGLRTLYMVKMLN